MVIKAVLVDIDNTLIDYVEMKHQSCEAAVDAMINAGLKMRKKRALAAVYDLYDRYGMDYGKIFQKFLKAEKGKVDYRLVAYAVRSYRDARELSLIPYPKVVSTLKKLVKKGYKLAVVTDAPANKAWERLVLMDIDNLFDVVVTMSDVRKTKTSMTPFRVALRKLGINANEGIMVGDRINRDVEVAKKVGLVTCYARYGDKKPVEPGLSGADFEINSFDEVLGIVGKIK
ncbi:MAG: HAD family hydrolase [Nanoarchaeota archaeon]|jgi:HAD superfamily hydrolase (TIGR02253 family)|nr:HAD family hydrolase [Nanoarchaeota archaeon]